MLVSASLKFETDLPTAPFRRRRDERRFVGDAKQDQPRASQAVPFTIAVPFCFIPNPISNGGNHAES
jgi:hypothetical protein